MKQTTKKTKHVATRTVWFSVLSSVALGLTILLVGLSIYGNSLMQDAISRARFATTRAGGSASHAADTVGLARDVMEVYNSLTLEQRSKTGTDEYRQRFRALDSVSGPEATYAWLNNIVHNYIADVSRMYVCVFDVENNAMVYLMDLDKNSDPGADGAGDSGDLACPGDWETAPEGWIEKLTNSAEYDWNAGTTPYDIRKTADGGRICVTAYPIRDENREIRAFLVAELSIDDVVTEIVQYALKISMLVLALTLLIAYLVGMRMKKTVADPINAIANAAVSYVQDRKNGIDRSDHFSSLNIRTGDELENLTDIMADMEQQLIAHEDQIEALLDSLVKALSTAIDDRSHYTGNHTHNMVLMAEAFLDWMEKNGNPWQYDEIHRRVFVMSVGLHDIGKLTVPLEIMDKSTRLGPGLRPIQDRFMRMRLLDQIAMLEGRISEAEYLQRTNEAEKNLALILRVNTIGFLPDEDLEKVKSLAACTFVDEDGSVQRLVTDDEITMLSIRKGTLTAEERSVMQGHATSTWNILNQVDFPVQYASIPMWASSHHELLQGNGYPNGISKDSIPREVRLLTILDIFEALTAKDRPYKTPFSYEKAWKILDSMVQEGSLDSELLALFKESRAWEALLPPEQRGEQKEV